MLYSSFIKDIWIKAYGWNSFQDKCMYSVLMHIIRMIIVRESKGNIYV